MRGCGRSRAVRNGRQGPLAAGRPMPVLAPFWSFNRLEVVRLATEVGVPIDRTYSSYIGRRDPCGGCPSCVDREKAIDMLARNI